jgi:DNA-binding transcriptional ArsR family regulator
MKEGDLFMQDKVIDQQEDTTGTSNIKTAREEFTNITANDEITTTATTPEADDHKSMTITNPEATEPSPGEINDEDRKRVAQSPKHRVPNAGTLINIPQTATDEELLASDDQAVETIVPGFITVGLNIITGKAKTGKSLLVLDTAISVATGGRAFGAIDVEQAEVLYLALEDSRPRLKARIAQMLHDFPATKLFHAAISWPRMGKGFFEALDHWLGAHPQTKMVIIDTFAKIRGFQRPGSSLYEKDYLEISALKAFADEHGLAVVLVHHLRKGDAQDTLDLVSGSVGITAAADTILIMTRNRGDAGANLYATGRDIEEKNLALKFNPVTLGWEITEAAVENALGQEKQEILDVLKKTKSSLKLGQIAEAVGKKRPVVHKHLAALIENGLVKQPAYGIYEAVIECEKSRESGESGETSVDTLQ